MRQTQNRDLRIRHDCAFKQYTIFYQLKYLKQIYFYQRRRTQVLIMMWICPTRVHPI